MCPLRHTEPPTPGMHGAALVLFPCQRPSPQLTAALTSTLFTLLLLNVVSVDSCSRSCSVLASFTCCQSDICLCAGVWPVCSSLLLRRILS